MGCSILFNSAINGVQCFYSTTAILLCRCCGIHPFSLLSSCGISFPARSSFLSVPSGTSISQSCPDRAELPLTLSQNYSQLSFRNCQDRIWMLLSKARDGGLPLIFHDVCNLQILSSQHISGIVPEARDSLYLGVKRKIGIMCLCPS